MEFGCKGTTKSRHFSYDFPDFFDKRSGKGDYLPTDSADDGLLSSHDSDAGM